MAIVYDYDKNCWYSLRIKSDSKYIHQNQNTDLKLLCEMKDGDSSTEWMVKYWLKKLELDYVIVIENISVFQVCDENFRIGNSFVGIWIDRNKKVGHIYHTRQLNEEDILHELLHIRYPYKSELKINKITYSLLDKKKNLLKKQWLLTIK